MSEQQKMDQERAQFEAEYAKFQGFSEKSYGLWFKRIGEHYESGSVASAWWGWQKARSLPVGVPDGWIAVTERMPEKGKPVQVWCGGSDSAGVAWRTDDAWHMPEPQALGYESITHWQPLAAAPTVKAEQVGMADAYVGAREDLAIWKRRALEAEQKARRQEQIIDHLTLEAQGETRFGEPSMPSAQPVAVIEYAGYDPANSIKWLNKGLQYMEPGTLLYAQAPSLPAAGSAVEEVEVVAYLGDGGTLYPSKKSADKYLPVGRTAEPLMTVAQHNRIVAALSAQQSAQHPDDAAVDRFAAAMKSKLAKSREKGRHGWQTASAAHLSSLLYHHMYKADPLDVANLAMMLHQNGQSIELPYEARKVTSQKSGEVSVQRELLERIQHLLDNYVTHINQEEEELRALLASHAQGGKV